MKSGIAGTQASTNRDVLTPTKGGAILPEGASSASNTELPQAFAIMVGASFRFWSVLVKQIAQKVRG